MFSVEDLAGTHALPALQTSGFKTARQQLQTKASVYFLRVIVFFALTCNFCNAWRPKHCKITLLVLKLDFDGQNVLQQCFLRVIAVFAMRTAKLDVQGDVFVIVK